MKHLKNKKCYGLGSSDAANILSLSKNRGVPKDLINRLSDIFNIDRLNSAECEGSYDIFDENGNIIDGTPEFAVVGALFERDVETYISQLYDFDDSTDIPEHILKVLKLANDWQKEYYMSNEDEAILDIPPTSHYDFFSKKENIILELKASEKDEAYLRKNYEAQFNWHFLSNNHTSKSPRLYVITPQFTFIYQRVEDVITSLRKGLSMFAFMHQHLYQNNRTRVCLPPIF